MRRRGMAYELDPLDPTAAFNLAYGLWIGRRFPEAVERFERALELHPRSAESGTVSSYHLALVFLGLGEYDAFFEWLERAHQERSTWMVWFHVSPSLDAVRGDSRFAGMVERMGLPEVASEWEGALPP